MSAAIPLPREVRIVRCAWCKDVTIKGSTTADVVSLELKGLYEFASVNHHQVLIEDGICSGCRATKFGDVPRKAVSNDLSQK